MELSAARGPDGDRHCVVSTFVDSPYAGWKVQAIGEQMEMEGSTSSNSYLTTCFAIGHFFAITTSQPVEEASSGSAEEAPASGSVKEASPSGSAAEVPAAGSAEETASSSVNETPASCLEDLKALGDAVDATSRDAFKYRPLDPAARWMRVLKLYPGARDDQLHVQLIHVPLDGNLVQYEALSYVWGDMNDTVEIGIEAESAELSTQIHADTPPGRYVEIDRQRHFDHQKLP